MSALLQLSMRRIGKHGIRDYRLVDARSFEFGRTGRMPKKDDINATPFSDAGLPLLASWIEFWMMPVTLGARMLGMSAPVAEDEPEIDRKCEHNQLPVPNAHQKDMDHDLFA